MLFAAVWKLVCTLGFLVVSIISVIRSWWGTNPKQASRDYNITRQTIACVEKLRETYPNKYERADLEKLFSFCPNVNYAICRLLTLRPDLDLRNVIASLANLKRVQEWETTRVLNIVCERPRCGFWDAFGLFELNPLVLNAACELLTTRNDVSVAEVLQHVFFFSSPNSAVQALKSMCEDPNYSVFEVLEEEEEYLYDHEEPPQYQRYESEHETKGEFVYSTPPPRYH